MLANGTGLLSLHSAQVSVWLWCFDKDSPKSSEFPAAPKPSAVTYKRELIVNGAVRYDLCVTKRSPRWPALSHDVGSQGCWPGSYSQQQSRCKSARQVPCRRVLLTKRRPCANSHAGGPLAFRAALKASFHAHVLAAPLDRSV